MLCWRVPALIIGVAALAPPALGSSGGPVAYTTYVRFQGLRLVTVNPDGTGSRVLVRGGDPAWSPDRRWLAYTHDYSEIWRGRADGTDAQRMVRARGGRDVEEPSWSPDGRRIAFTFRWSTGWTDIDEVEHSAVYVANRDGSGKRLLRRDALRPAWSPDGRRIAMQTTRGVATIKPNGRAFKVLHRSQRRFPDWGPPRFSPDGRWLLFRSRTPAKQTVAAYRTNLLNMRTGRLRRIPLDAMPGLNRDVTWTPDGKIAFLHKQWSRGRGTSPRRVQLKTIWRDGTNARTLANLKEQPALSSGLSWRPTG